MSVASELPRPDLVRVAAHPFEGAERRLAGSRHRLGEPRLLVEVGCGLDVDDAEVLERALLRALLVGFIGHAHVERLLELFAVLPRFARGQGPLLVPAELFVLQLQLPDLILQQPHLFLRV